MMQNEKDDLLKKLKEKEIIGNKTNSWYVYNPMHNKMSYNKVYVLNQLRHCSAGYVSQKLPFSLRIIVNFALWYLCLLPCSN